MALRLEAPSHALSLLLHCSPLAIPGKLFFFPPSLPRFFSSVGFFSLLFLCSHFPSCFLLPPPCSFPLCATCWDILFPLHLQHLPCSLFLQPLGRDPGTGVCTLALSLVMSQLGYGNSQDNLLYFAVTYGDWFLPFYIFFHPVRNCSLKKAHFSCLLGVPVCHFYKSVFIGLIIVNAEPNKGDCDCNI